MEGSAMPGYAGHADAAADCRLVSLLQTLNAPCATGGVAGTPRGGGRAAVGRASGRRPAADEVGPP